MVLTGHSDKEALAVYNSDMWRVPVGCWAPLGPPDVVVLSEMGFHVEFLSRSCADVLAIVALVTMSMQLQARNDVRFSFGVCNEVII